jgi:hypothetical protein
LGLALLSSSSELDEEDSEDDDEEDFFLFFRDFLWTLSSEELDSEPELLSSDDEELVDLS